MQKGADEIDYRETADVTRVHGAVKREHREPEAGTIPVPLWLFAVVIAVTLGSGFYFGMFSGGFSGSVLNEREGIAGAKPKAAAAGAGAETAKVETLAEQGKKLYSNNCASCHQPTGLGVAGQFPPLAKSEWVQGSTRRLTMLVLKGLHGPLTVEGVTYNGAMPAWAPTLSDKKVAAILSYIRSSWGNVGGEVTPEQVAVIRKEVASRTEPYVQADLKDISGDIEAAPAAAK